MKFRNLACLSLNVSQVLVCCLVTVRRNINSFDFLREVRDEVLYVLMERGDMDLSKYLKTHKQCGEDVFKMYWKQMLCAVNAIHKQGIIHTDLKPANFLLVNNNLKLIDFGIANSVQVL